MGGIILIKGIILGAGRSVRMKKQKLLMPFANTTVIETVIKKIIETDCFEEIVLVYNEILVYQIGKKYKLKSLYNPTPELGLSSSIKIGIQSTPTKIDKFMFFMGDQPLITQCLVKDLVEKSIRSNKSIIVPVYKGNKGMPSIFSSKWKKELLQIKGDIGGREIIKNNIDEVELMYVDDDAQGIDVDTEIEYYRAMELYNKYNL